MEEPEVGASRPARRGRRGRASAVVGALVLAGLLAGCSGSDSGEPEEPEASTTTTAAVVPADVTVSGPISGGVRGLPYVPMGTGLAEEYGYTEEEYFISGTAPSYTPTAPLTADGMWTVSAGPEAPYTSRIVVRRPEDPDDFNGTVVVEWLNVSATRESDPDFGSLHPYLMREGYAYVSVSAQSVGIMGGQGSIEVPGAPPEALLAAKDWDPVRYEPMQHPGDTWSYGIFTDVADLLRAPGPLDPLSGLVPERLIAAGQSQSAGRLTTYVDAVQPVTGVFDGFLIHSRGDSSARLDDTDAGKPPASVAIRPDAGVPVLVFQTETELVRSTTFAARQPDTATLRIWETAGTAHADQDSLDYGALSGSRWTTASYDPTPYCGTINDGPVAPVVRAAMASLEAWVVDGTPPPTAPRLEVTDAGVVRDEHGNAVGGIRTPAVDAPVSTLSGAGNPSSVFCSLFGQRTEFDATQLRALYGDHQTYVDRVTASADAAVAARFLLPEERDELVTAAKASAVPEG